MWVETSRFGRVQVEADRVIRFPKGLLGFPGHTDFVLLETGDESYFWWLQAVDEPDLAFVVTDPSLFVNDYRVPIKPEQMSEMNLESLDQAQVLVIVNKRDTLLTGNLQGPLVVNVLDRTGEQMVLAERRYTTREPLVELGQRVQALSA